MSYEAWMLNAMEEKGYTDTEKGLNNRLVEAIDELDEDEIDTETFIDICIEKGIDPDTVTEEDLDYIQSRLR
ncbi:MAG: hypothetical protein ACLS8Q_03890 [Anaerovoracaceae bacterium]